MMRSFATHPNAQQARKRRFVPDACDRVRGNHPRPWRPSPSFTRCCHLQMNRYYFQIKDANVLECIKASSFEEAKAIAFDDWCSMWNRIEWLTPQTLTEVSLPDV
jgi:hypothetical protein